MTKLSDIDPFRKRRVRQRRITWFLLIVLAACTEISLAQGNRKQIEEDLGHQLIGSYLSLRQPNPSNRIHFASDGALKGSASPTPWTTEGLLKLTKVSVKSNSIDMEGDRVIVAWRLKANPALMTVVTERKVKIALDLDSPVADMKQAALLLGKIFESGSVDKKVSTAWSPNPDVSDPKDASPSPSQSDPIVVGVLDGDRPVYKSKRGKVQPPRALYAPNPGYTESARKKKFQGAASLNVVVNENGLPEIIQISQDLGYGLDLRALDTISQWRFSPATMNGTPVAAIIGVKVAFRLY